MTFQEFLWNVERGYNECAVKEKRGIWFPHQNEFITDDILFLYSLFYKYNDSHITDNFGVELYSQFVRRDSDYYLFRIIDDSWTVRRYPRGAHPWLWREQDLARLTLVGPVFKYSIGKL
jgi:hypothetical protein